MLTNCIGITENTFDMVLRLRVIVICCTVVSFPSSVSYSLHVRGASGVATYGALGHVPPFKFAEKKVGARIKKKSAYSNETAWAFINYKLIIWTGSD